MKCNKEKWNEIQKPSEIDVEAVDGDITEVIDNIIFLCQRTNNYNNICCLSLSNSPNCSGAVRAMFKFCIVLYEKYGVEFVRVEGNLKRYRFLEQLFSREEVIKDLTVQNRNVYYCNIKKANKRLKELS